MHSDTMAAHPTIGKLLKGQYRIDRELGRGAMGMVFFGMNVQLGKPVAVKMLQVGGFGSRDAQERFEREARTASMLVHPGIAQVFDYGIEDGMPFLVMEYVDGKELADVISDEGPMTSARALAIMRQLASVMEEAHKHGIVHRDIKPQNLKLMRYAPGGQLFLKVLDFGIAKQTGEGQGKLTATGAVIGTPMYMAPEQASGASKGVDGRADQYAAGIVLYEMLTGNVPFTGDSLAGVLVSHLTQPPPPLPRSVPEPLRQIVDRLLKKSPDERFPDCAALDRALQAAESSCRDVPALGRDSVQPVVSHGLGGSKANRLGARIVFGLGALTIAGAVMAAVLIVGPRLRERRGAQPPPDRPAQVEPRAAQKDPAPVAPVPAPAQKVVAPVDPLKGPGDRAHRHKRDPGQTEEPPDSADRPSDPEAKAKLDEAQRLFQQRQYQEAIQVARQSAGLQKSGQAWRLITLSYCALGDLGNAKASFHRVSASHRKQVVDRCGKSDIDLSE